MAKDNVIIGAHATKALLSGIKTATDAIRLSYGARGVNAIIEQDFYPYHVVANDCETILQSIQVTGKYEKVGLDLLKELSSKAHKDSGDGRKTTCIIGEEIMRRGFESGILGVQLKRELDELIPIIEKKIDEQKKTITEEEVHKVATIASEDPLLGNLLGDIYKKIGKDGIIIPEGSGTYSTTWDFIEGVRFVDTGYLSPFMAHDEDAVKEGRRETCAVYKKPKILVTKNKIEKDADIERLLEICIKDNTPLVIFTDDMDSGVASRIISAHKNKLGKFLIIKAPTLWKNYVFEDFAKVTGSTIVEDSSGINFKNLELSHLGTCDKITVDKEETTIVGGEDVSHHIEMLKTNGDNDSLRRVAWLTTKTCVLRLGANNESELSYKRLKCYDAINACKLALKDGIVAGGGISLLNVIPYLPDTDAGRIVARAIKEPFAQILSNAGLAQDGTMKLNCKSGIDTNSGQVVDMFKAGIVDASAVVKNAVRNAISLASTVLTGQILIVIPEKSPQQIAAEALQSKGLRF